jgi:hypothetical protein
MGRGRSGGRSARPCRNGSYGCNGNRCLRCGDERRADRAERAGWQDGGAVDGEPAKVRQEGGRVEALWGGEGSPDGEGHGHIVSNGDGVAAYVRYPGEERDNPTFDDPGNTRRR